MTLAGDVGAWFTNVASSVMIIFVNKVLMGKHGYGYNFAVTLSAFHYLTSATLMQGYKWSGFMTVTKSMGLKDLVLYCFVSNMSIISLNVSLMVNQVGFYQIAKLMVIPFVCLVEAFVYKRAFSRPVIFSISTVVVGVAIVTVSSISVGFMGFNVALLSIVAAGSQQLLCGYMQRTSGMSSTEMLLYTAWPMGFSLLIIGPFLDWFVTGGRWVTEYPYVYAVNMTILATCGLAVGVNVSQFMCLGRFSAVAYQVMGHTKTICVLLGGALFFNEAITVRSGCGMALAVAGMVGYGYYSQLENKPKPAAPEPEKQPLTDGMSHSGPQHTFAKNAQKESASPTAYSAYSGPTRARPDPPTHTRS